RAELHEILLEFIFPLVGEHAFADLIARLVELENLRGCRRLELENLESALRADDLRHLAGFEPLDQLAKISRDFAHIQRTDQAAVRLGRRIRDFGRDLLERLATCDALADLLRLRLRSVVCCGIDAARIRWNV